MARTTPSNVISILLGNYDGSSDLTGVIDTAALMVDRVLACALRKSVVITDQEAEMIERYLAAHYYGHSDQFFQSKATMSASGSFQGQTGKGLDGSQYGQTAQSLDPSGCLSALSKNNRATMAWLGKPTNAQISARDRGNY